MTIPRPLLGALIVAQLATVAVAGEINEKSGVAISGYDPVAYFVQSKPIEGKADLAVTYRDARFLFASEENRKAFEANPGKYAPQYGGFLLPGTFS
ncbi:YHS domain-containing protein [Ensifer sp. T173]|uniref:YHS domain-containing protein n=1 Tax=Ensifer canadensis TaxID=555315 RepID=A0AAW4FL35_9HYPH|nr:YHS domain-containing (seleno)protein [Ensifer canadensis]MBM3091225.1 YHS domain-containing protein [Ensifer canadensis]UBI78747.1 YHS domain-containing protein [Ensifer canadensis]